MKERLMVVCVFFIQFISVAQNKVNENNYTFYLYESFGLESSMKKRAINFTSSFRLIHNSIQTDSISTWKKLLINSTLYFSQYLLLGVSHEEGHRSVLTTNNIGSVSSPFFDENGVAMVKGVLDSSIIKLRNNNLPSYLRLYTAGLESDYLIIENCNELIAFEEDEMKNVLPSLIVRNIAGLNYYLTAVLPSLSPDIVESEDELNNDIVGHDLYGAVKNMHRPYSSFKRYTNHSDLTKGEKSHLKSMAFGSLLNLISPAYLKFKYKGITFSTGTGYALTPFGELFELSLWMKSKYKIGISGLLYKSQNRYGKGLNIVWKDLKLIKNLDISFRTSLFQQPKNLNYSDQGMFIGGLVHTQLKYKFGNIIQDKLSVFLSHTYKTKGFVVGESFLNEKSYFDFGAVIRL